MRQQLLSRFFSPVGLSFCPASEPATTGGPFDVSGVVWPPHTTGTCTNSRKRSRSGSPEEESDDAGRSRCSRWPGSFVQQPGLGQSEAQFQAQAPYTPLEAQVVELKAKYPDVLLLVEVGYRYRFFAEDAQTASRVLGIVAHRDHNFLTASIPTFRLHVHIRRLVEAGHKVGVVRQAETAAIKAHGPNKVGRFSRHLSALYTRSTLAAAGDVFATDLQDLSAPRYLICITDDTGPEDNATLAVVAVNTATGDVLHGHFHDNMARSKLEAVLLALSPVEYLLAVPACSATHKLLCRFKGSSKEVRLEYVPRDGFDLAVARAEMLSSASCQQELESQHASAMRGLVVEALALAMWYLKQFSLEKLVCNRTAFRPLFDEREMSLHPNVIRQLEILSNSADGTEKGSLLWFMDHTRTPFGARLFRHWVTHPLCDRALIEGRLDALAEIMDSLKKAGFEGSTRGLKRWSGEASTLLQSCKTSSVKSSGALLACTLMSLNKLPDVEQGITRILHHTATAAEFVRTMGAILSYSKHLKILSNQKTRDGVAATSSNHVEYHGHIRSQLLQRLVAAASSSALMSHASNLLLSLNVEAAVVGDKLNVFSSTSNRFPEVSSCHFELEIAKRQTDNLLVDFRKVLNMPGLQYTSVSGTSYLIEVPTSHTVPSNWLKVNSTKKVNRYHPPEIMISLDKIALAEEHLTAACSRAWELFLADCAVHYADFRTAVHALAALDCLLALALLSSNQEYTRPIFCEERQPSQLMIQAGRHPVRKVLESKLAGNFVANDTFLHAELERCQLITGPNMGGKSSYLRQVALITIMAQMGSYVPAASARLHVVDAIFTRMGASDKIEHGSSTFFEELTETSFILHNASPHSLVIVDELGRGTSTHDGVAIAYATLRYLLTVVRCIVLFVTHYPEVAGLKALFPAEIVPLHVSFLRGQYCRSHVGQVPLFYSAKDLTPLITFLYKLMPGVANSSFGLHVAQVAQIPSVCLSRATALAGILEMCATGFGKEATSEILPHELERSSGGGQAFSLQDRHGICCMATDKYLEVFNQLREITCAVMKGCAAEDTAAALLSLQLKISRSGGQR